MLECLAEWMMQPLYVFHGTGRVLPRAGVRHAAVVPYGLYGCADGAVNFGIQNDREFARFCREVLGTPELAADERFATNTARVKNRCELEARIEEWFGGADAGGGAGGARPGGDCEWRGERYCGSEAASAACGAGALDGGGLAGRADSRAAAAAQSAGRERRGRGGFRRSASIRRRFSKNLPGRASDAFDAHDVVCSGGAAADDREGCGERGGRGVHRPGRLGAAGRQGGGAGECGRGFPRAGFRPARADAADQRAGYAVRLSRCGGGGGGGGGPDRPGDAAEGGVGAGCGISWIRC